VRIATANAYQNALDAMNQRQAQLIRSQEELSSGRKVISPSDDPGVAANAERNRAEQRRLEAQTRINEYAMGNLSQAESVLGSITDLMQSVRESVIQAGNGGYTANDRRQIATQLRVQRDELLALANRTDGNGGYLFGGMGSGSAPFVDSGGTVLFQAQSGQREVGLGEAAVAAALDGRHLLMSLPNGPGAVKSVFDVLDSLATALENPNLTSPNVGTLVRSTLADIDVAMERVSTQRTDVGESLRALEARLRLAQDGKLELSSQLSSMIDIDYAKSITEFQNHQTAVSAAMRTYAQIAKMSLFDYL
jgi:flagellar hook-associated protein 3 FlgL